MEPTRHNLLLPSPLQACYRKQWIAHNLSVYIKREDLIHPLVSGNKWRKLSPNLGTILHGHHAGLVTFGGAFSNHIHATAAAGHLYGCPTVGIIRGEEDLSNPTLIDARKWGMTLHYVSRSAYREKEDNHIVQSIIATYPSYLVLPEGGSNSRSLHGTRTTMIEIQQQCPSTQHIVVAAGTGATAAGIISGATADQMVWVVSALRGAHLTAKIDALLASAAYSARWTVLEQYHRGGYAKVDPDLVAYIHAFYQETGIPLEPIYTAKTMMAVDDLIANGRIQDGSSVTIIHTGGLQGITAHNYMAVKRNRRHLLISTS